MKRKQNFLKAAILLCITPLLMGNSAMPYPKDSKYEDYVISYLEEPLDEELSKYSFEIKNTGNGYISTKRLYYRVEDKMVSFGETIPYFFGFETLFYPGGTFKFEKTIDKGDYNFSKENMNVFAFTDIDTDVKISGTKQLFLDETYESTEKNRYHIDVTFSNLNDAYRYDYGVKLEYEGITYCSMVLNQNGKIFAVFDQKIDASKISISEIIPFKYVYNSKSPILGIILTVILVLFLMTLLAPIIVLPIVFGVRKKRRQKRQNA